MRGGKKGEKLTEDEERKKNASTFLGEFRAKLSHFEAYLWPISKHSSKMDSNDGISSRPGRRDCQRYRHASLLVPDNNSGLPLKTATGAEHGSEARKHSAWWPRLQPLDVDDEQTAAVAFP